MPSNLTELQRMISQQVMESLQKGPGDELPAVISVTSCNSNSCHSRELAEVLGGSPAQQ